MKTIAASSLRRWWVASCCALFAPAAYAGPVLDFFFPRPELQTITVTDYTPAGRLHRQPTPGAPVYYAAVSAGYRDFGGLMGGERPIPREVVNKTMLTVLAKQGYLPVRSDQQPDIVLLWSWGTMNVERFSIDPNWPAPQLNERQMRLFLGARKLGLESKYNEPFPEQMLLPGLMFATGEARELLDVAKDNLYVVLIAAYDTKLRDPKHGLLLWNTRISSPSRGFWLPEALPAMLVIASPNIGRETDKPVWIRATERFKPEVKLGDIKVVEYLESEKPAIANLGHSK
ncbi:MAG TPA: hypothetical protein VG710_14025 [Opitutus sp.]|nr:hypothetical protein [Opitutus sp.]